jgi:nitrite reductase/ring-hydroxylating ferredoxin subunit
MANATIVMSGVIGLIIGIPLIDYSIPGKRINELSGKVWSPVDQADWTKLTTSQIPLKISFTRKTADGYFLPEATEDYVWGVKMSPAQWAKMKRDRTDLFTTDKAEQVTYPDEIYVAGYVIFSSICPHLGCRFAWDTSRNVFFCPCHNSTYTRDGLKIAGPAPRGLDPLPLREVNGKAEITWIRYKSSTPDRIIVSYS